MSLDDKTDEELKQARHDALIAYLYSVIATADVPTLLALSAAIEKRQAEAFERFHSDEIPPPFQERGAIEKF